MAIHPTTKIAVSDLDTLDQLLDEVPVHRDTSVSKQRAIGILAPKLYAMRAKGYSWGDIAAGLVDHGLTITRVALQGYLRRVRSVDANADSGAARPRPSRARERLASRPPRPPSRNRPRLRTRRPRRRHAPGRSSSAARSLACVVRSLSCVLARKDI